mmetsp:Transcript_3427/g.7527  ORF Transcript_3427/g.7527 Transcript_3427/m.7527 type:complete len:306 (-) Transcript_3427:64-981(-)
MLVVVKVANPRATNRKSIINQRFRQCFKVFFFIFRATLTVQLLNFFFNMIDFFLNHHIILAAAVFSVGLSLTHPVFQCRLFRVLQNFVEVLVVIKIALPSTPRRKGSHDHIFCHCFKTFFLFLGYCIILVFQVFNLFFHMLDLFLNGSVSFAGAILSLILSLIKPVLQCCLFRMLQSIIQMFVVIKVTLPRTLRRKRQLNQRFRQRLEALLLFFGCIAILAAQLFNLLFDMFNLLNNHFLFAAAILSFVLSMIQPMFQRRIFRVIKSAIQMLVIRKVALPGTSRREGRLDQIFLERLEVFLHIFR